MDTGQLVGQVSVSAVSYLTARCEQSADTGGVHPLKAHFSPAPGLWLHNSTQGQELAISTYCHIAPRVWQYLHIAIQHLESLVHLHIHLIHIKYSTLENYLLFISLGNIFITQSREVLEMSILKSAPLLLLCRLKTYNTSA